MSIQNNIWEIAEAYVNGTLSESGLIELNSRIAANSDFANEFNECTNLLRSMEDAGEQKRFRNTLREIHEEVVNADAKQQSRRIQLPAHFWRTAAVAAGVALLTSTIT